VHSVPEAVHVVNVTCAPPRPPAPVAPPQHVWLKPPQAAPVMVWHDPLLQVPVVPAPVQAAPLARHVPPTQHPSALHAFAAQQTCPDPPQATVVPPGPSLVVVLPPQAPPRVNNAAKQAINSNRSRPTSGSEYVLKLRSPFWRVGARVPARVVSFLRDDERRVTHPT